MAALVSGQHHTTTASSRLTSKNRLALPVLLCLLAVWPRVTSPMSADNNKWCEFAAAEESRHSVACDGADVQDKRDFQWRLEYKSGSSATLICLNRTQACYNPGNNVTSTYSRRPRGRVTSELILHHVTGRDRDVNISCGHFNRTTREFLPVQSCVLQVYWKPERAECSVKMVDKNSARIVCIVARIYPGVVCDLIQHDVGSGESPLSSSRPEPVYETEVQYYNRYEHPYLWASCTMDVFLPHPGAYVYFVRLTPNVRANHQGKASLLVGVDGLISIQSPALTVQLTGPDLALSLCPASQEVTLTLVCEAHGYRAMPHFRWSLEREQGGTGRGKERVVNGDMSFYRDTRNVTVTRFNNGARVRCRVSNQDHQITLSAEDSHIINLHWPPLGPPVFTDDKGLVLVGSVNLTDTTRRLMCQVKEGRPEAASTAVSCQNIGTDGKADDGSEPITFASTGTRVRFSVKQLEKGDYLCTCSATHMTRCYSQVSALLVHARRGVVSSSRADVSGPTTLSVYLTALLWIVVTLCLILAILIPLLLWFHSPRLFCLAFTHSYDYVQAPPLHYAVSSVRPLPPLPGITTDSEGYLCPVLTIQGERPQDGANLVEDDYLIPSSSISEDDWLFHVGSHSSIDEGSHNSIDEGSHNSIDKDSRYSIDEGSYNSIDKDSRNSIDEGSHDSIDKDSRYSIDEGSRNSIDEGSRNSVDEGSRNSIDEDKDSRYSIDEGSYNNSDEGSRNSKDEGSRYSIDEGSHNSRADGSRYSIDEGSRNSIDEGSRNCREEESHNSIDEGSRNVIDITLLSDTYEGSRNVIDITLLSDTYEGSQNG